MFNVIPSDKGLIKAWTNGVPVEEAAIEQLRNIASMPFIYKHLAVMPDVHLGKGATVGSVVVTKGAVIPAAVGVDIGCGMIAVRTNLTASDLPDNLFAIRSKIEEYVPHGRTDDGGVNDAGAHKDIGADTYLFKNIRELMIRLGMLVAKHPELEKASRRAHLHAGTLGGGNHFIEICLDTSNDVWIMLHSGSRGIGNKIGQTFIAKAKKDMERWFISLPDNDLAYLAEGSKNYHDYIEAVSWAQEFASVNRKIMLQRTIEAMEFVLGREVVVDEKAISCHHNYISEERHFGNQVLVTRKGAVSAKEGEMGIIPGSMGAKSFIVRGKGNRESFCSCSHGAGRVMSRTEAKRTFTVADHENSTEGVECRKDVDVIDETPKAYKDIDAVMAAQSDLVDIVHTLKQILCVKG